MSNLESFLKLPTFMNPEDFTISKDGVLIYEPEKITFFRITSKGTLSLYLALLKNEIANNKKMGVLSDSLNSSEKTVLKELEISFISIGDEAVIFTKDGVINYKIHKKKEKEKFAYTTLMSPAGFDILDTVLNLTNDELRAYSALALSNEYALVQPKISNILKVCNVKSLVELKDWILSKDLKWWKEGFLERKTRRFLTPFDIHKRYISIEKKKHQDILSSIMNSCDWNQNISFSGVQLLKEHKEVIDNQLYLAIVPSFEKELFKRYSLAPAPNHVSDSVANITILRKDFSAESFFSRIKVNNKLQFNVLRMMWGIQSEDSRIQEARFDVLVRYLNERK